MFNSGTANQGAYFGLVLCSINDDACQLLLVPGLCSLEDQEEMGYVAPECCHLLLYHTHLHCTVALGGDKGQGGGEGVVLSTMHILL